MTNSNDLQSEKSLASPEDLLDELVAELTENFSSDLIVTNKVEHGTLVLRIASTDCLLAICRQLRDEPRFRFTQLSDITATDWPQRQPRFVMAYHLLSLHENVRLRLQFSLDDNEITPSVNEIWPAANWYEREVWDMFGLAFSAHPDLRRILSDYGFEGHPLRKDFPLSGHVELAYDVSEQRIVRKPIELTQDYRNFDFTMPWQGANGQGAMGQSSNGQGSNGQGATGQQPAAQPTGTAATTGATAKTGKTSNE